MGNPGNGGGGGLLRDGTDNLVFAFCKSFGFCSNNEAELRAVLEELILCKQIGCLMVDIEYDSLVVINWILAKRCTIWHL